jgi:hypothetical protein
LNADFHYHIFGTRDDAIVSNSSLRILFFVHISAETLPSQDDEMIEGWGLLTLWALGWGLQYTDDRDFIPSPDAIWSAFCLAAACVYFVHSRWIARRAARGDYYAAASSVLPVYRALLADVVVGLCVLLVLALLVMVAANLRFSGTIYVLAPLNFLRWFVYELITESVGLFFLQPILGRRALYRALVPAAIWAVFYASVNVSLLVTTYSTDGLVQRCVVAGLNLAIAAAYGIGSLALNFGRPALRPYAWFSVVQRGVVCAGLVLSAFRPPGFPILLFDLIMMLVQVLLLPGAPATTDDRAAGHLFTLAPSFSFSLPFSSRCSGSPLLASQLCAQTRG